MDAAKLSSVAGNVLKIELVDADSTFHLEHVNQVTWSEIAAGQELSVNLIISTNDDGGISESDEYEPSPTDRDWMPCRHTESLANVERECEH